MVAALAVGGVLLAAMIAASGYGPVTLPGDVLLPAVMRGPAADTTVRSD